MSEIQIRDTAGSPRLHDHARHFRVYGFYAHPDGALIDLSLDRLDHVGFGVKNAFIDQRSIKLDHFFSSIIDLIQWSFIMALDPILDEGYASCVPAGYRWHTPGAGKTHC